VELSDTAPGTALVTGASRGIGLAIAEELAREGYRLTISARRKDGLDEAAARLRSVGSEVLAVRANIASEAEVAALVGAHSDEYGRLDVLVNNAGIGVRGFLSSARTEHIDLQLAVNLRGTILMCREALGMLSAAGAEHRRAHIINVSSIAGKVGEAQLAVYAATKHGIVGFSDSLGRELYRDGIRVTAICPGLVDTEMSRYADGFLPAARKIETRDLAEVVRFLLRLSVNAVIPEVILAEAAALGLAGTAFQEPSPPHDRAVPTGPAGGTAPEARNDYPLV
jgi:NAD(P)-dependent dehydrogenase (short-subunit alcohol dehydrogenase family)